MPGVVWGSDSESSLNWPVLYFPEGHSLKNFQVNLERAITRAQKDRELARRVILGLKDWNVVRGIERAESTRRWFRRGFAVVFLAYVLSLSTLLLSSRIRTALLEMLSDKSSILDPFIARYL